MSNSEKKIEYLSKYDFSGRWVSVRADEAHLPHIRVSWYDGGIWMSGECAVLPNETPEGAAERAFHARHVPGGSVRGRVGDSVTISECLLFDAPLDYRPSQRGAR